jgi:hypothetical protein
MVVLAAAAAAALLQLQKEVRRRRRRRQRRWVIEATAWLAATVGTETIRCHLHLKKFPAQQKVAACSSAHQGIMERAAAQAAAAVVARMTMVRAMVVESTAVMVVP